MSDEPIIVDRKPVRIDPEYFRRRYGQNFPDLLDFSMETEEFLEECINDIYTMFHGVQFLWNVHDDKVWYQKTRMCYGLLLAWYITDTYPEYNVGVPTMGGMPVRSKNIGGVKIVFGNPDVDGTHGLRRYKDHLAQLKTNPFGYKAYTMINGAVQMVKIRGRL